MSGFGSKVGVILGALTSDFGPNGHGAATEAPC
jgi:hypothetical protein